MSDEVLLRLERLIYSFEKFQAKMTMLLEARELVDEPTLYRSSFDRSASVAEALRLECLNLRKVLKHPELFATQVEAKDVLYWIERAESCLEVTRVSFNQYFTHLGLDYKV
jgi:hypothetical protein